MSKGSPRGGKGSQHWGGRGSMSKIWTRMDRRLQYDKPSTLRQSTCNFERKAAANSGKVVPRLLRGKWQIAWAQGGRLLRALVYR